MKNTLLCGFMAAVLALGLCGCVVPDPNPTESGTAPEGTETEPMPEGNGLFTDAFFADVVEIRDISCGQVFEDQMMPVVLYLKDLKLTPTDVCLTPSEEDEITFGPGSIVFVKRDGREIVFWRNHAVLSSSDGTSYHCEGEDLITGLKEAFRQAINQSNEE